MRETGEEAPLARRPLILAGALLGTSCAFLSIDASLGDHVDGDAIDDENRGAREDGRIDWMRLQRENHEVVAWLTVDETPIDLPVVQPSETFDRLFYLDHGFNRLPDPMGTPYLDTRCKVDGDHRLVFSHHVIGNEQAMFSPVHRAFEPEVFARIGRAHWETPDSHEMLEPACALKVDERYTTIQRFAFAGREDWNTWMNEIARDAQVRNPSLEAILEDSSRCLTLATCSSPIANQRERTLLLFCEP